MTVTRAAAIADYILSTGIGDTEAAWRAEVKEAIAARWPGVTAEELTAAFQIALVETAAAWAGTLADRIEAAAAAAQGRPADGR